MKHFVGLDVSMKETAVCVVDDVGRRIWEGSVPSSPDVRGSIAASKSMLELRLAAVKSCYPRPRITILRISIMTKPIFFASIALVSMALLGCMKTVDATDSQIKGTIHSGLNRVKVGMTAQEVRAIIGAPQNDAFGASSGDSVCRSYVYDETIGAKFAHVFYLNDRVTQASEGHKTPCPPMPDVL